MSKTSDLCGFCAKLSDWCILCMYPCTHMKLSYFSPKTCFFMHFSEQCQNHPNCVVFLHKLTVWCVLYIYPCTHTEWSYFSPKTCFLMHFGDKCQKHAVCVFFVHKPSVWSVNAAQCVFTRFAMFCACIFARTQNYHISVQKHAF